MDRQRSSTVPAWQRAVALAGSLLFLGFALGCMSLSIGDRTEVVSPNDAQTQQGTVTIPANQSLDVFYPTPYVATPNLVVENNWNDCRVEEQQPNHFRVYNPGPFSREITWTTRGEKVPADVLLQNAKAAPDVKTASDAKAGPGQPPEDSTVAGVGP